MNALERSHFCQDFKIFGGFCNTKFMSELMQAFKIHEPMFMRRHFKIIKNNLIDCHFYPCIIRVSVKRNNGLHVFRLTENRNNDSDDNLWLYTMSRKSKVLPKYCIALNLLQEGQRVENSGDEFKKLHSKQKK